MIFQELDLVLVRTHPETGTKAVWFHKAKTETVTGMSPAPVSDAGAWRPSY
jgi:hypothetical protein